MSAVVQDVAPWQPVLDAHADLFESVVPGASMALIPRWSTDAQGQRRANFMQKTDPVPMQIWLREPRAMAVRGGEFRGLADLASDLLLLAEDGALAEALAHARPLSELKRRLRRGKLLFMVMRTRDELRERGWADFLEALGLPFLGTCR
jgi:hypothetical protein